MLFHDSNWQTPAPGNGHTVYQGGGDGMDRILAGPGDTVAWKNGELWIRRSAIRFAAPERWMPSPIKTICKCRRACITLCPQ